MFSLWVKESVNGKSSAIPASKVLSKERSLFLEDLPQNEPEANTIKK
jgi:hypothetical protein